MDTDPSSFNESTRFGSTPQDTLYVVDGIASVVSNATGAYTTFRPKQAGTLTIPLSGEVSARLALTRPASIVISAPQNLASRVFASEDYLPELVKDAETLSHRHLQCLVSHKTQNRMPTVEELTAAKGECINSLADQLLDPLPEGQIRESPEVINVSLKIKDDLDSLTGSMQFEESDDVSEASQPDEDPKQETDTAALQSDGTVKSNIDDPNMHDSERK